MIDGLNLKFDGFSFFLGLIAGVFLCVFLFQFRGWLPRIRAIFDRNLQKFKDRNLSGIDGAVRQETLKRTQHAHLSAQMFSLDEILIPPKLIAFPTNTDPAEAGRADFVFSHLFPDLPDWPEIASQYPVDFINLAEAVQGGANIVVIGAPGAGKTVALAHLASQFARRDPALKDRAELLPIYLHILDILPQTNQDLQDIVDPLDLILRIVSSHLPVWYQARASGVIRKALVDGAAIFLLDGLDELPAQSLKEAVAILRKLRATLPKLQMVATATPLSLDGILLEGFYPFSLATWNMKERQAFIQGWGKTWNEKLAPEMLKKGIEPLDPIFGSSWISPNPLNLNPLEWTLWVWAVYAGDTAKMTMDEALRAFIYRNVQSPKLLTPIFSLAVQMIAEKKIGLDQIELDELVKKNAIGSIQLFNPSDNAQADGGKDKAAKKETSAGLFLQSLAKTGLLIEHAGQVFRFCHPLIQSYCAACQLDENINDWADDPEAWDPKIFALGYGYSQKPAVFTTLPSWISEEPPLYRKIMWFSRTIKGLPLNHPVRGKMMRRLVDGLVDEQNLTSVRLAFASALATTREPSVIQYFQQVLTSPKSDLREIGCLMLGAAQDPNLIPGLTAMLSDPIEKVRAAACCALGNISSAKSMSVLEHCLTLDDDILRQASAEALAANSELGHAVLKTASESDNLLSRRSVVFGLARIPAPWARDMLEQIAIKDSQWVVRNAASQALEISQKNQHLIPEPLTMASETSWLIAFAGRQGMGIQTGDPAIDILINALQSGSPEERMAALNYLRLYPQENVLQAVLKAASQPDPGVSEAAELAIWFLTCLKPDASKVFRTVV